MKECIYAGSFDPFHNGHQHVVERALKMFGIVHVLVATNPTKKPLLNTDVKIEVIKKALKNHPFVKVAALPSNMLLSDYAAVNRIPVIVKGIRSMQDADYEKMLHEVTVSQAQGVDTAVLFSSPDDQKISSSAVRELMKYNADVTNYVPAYTKQVLEIAQGQAIIGWTGTIGAGKSYLANLMVKYGHVNHIDIDKISLDLTYNTAINTPDVQYLRAEVADEVGRDYKDEVMIPHKQKLSERVFSDPTFNKKIWELYRPFIEREVRRQLVGKQGLFIIDSALLIEANLTHLCNYNIVLVESSKQDRYQRLIARYHSPEEVYRRQAAQLTSEDKINAFAAQCDKNGNGNGNCICLNNSSDSKLMQEPLRLHQFVYMAEQLKPLIQKIGVNWSTPFCP